MLIYRYANVGRPGSVHDAAVFRDSRIFEMFGISNLSTNYHIIADGAFPLLKWLMKPYTKKELNATEINFNYRLSSARMTVENAFGRLKGRWRILSKRMDFSLSHCKNIIKACLILHNLCEINNDCFHNEWVDDLDIIDVPQRNFNDNNTQTPKFMRNCIAECLMQN